MEEEKATPAPEDLVSIDQAAAALGRSPRLVWNLARDYNLPRYRTPAQGKTTLLRWSDVLEAYNTPQAIEPRAKKAAA
jgi:hypothetical protein